MYTLSGPATDKPLTILEVPLKMATPENLEGYGTIVTDYDAEEVEIVPWPVSGWRQLVPGTGNEGGIVEDTFEMEWRGQILYTVNNAVNKSYITGWTVMPDEAREDVEVTDRPFVLTHEANYHPDGGQVFFSRNNEPFVALLALPGDDVKPEDFVAFYVDGSFGIQIRPNVWHQPVFPCNPRVTFDDKQGAVHGCVPVNFSEEFGVLLKVPLRF